MKTKRIIGVFLTLAMLISCIYPVSAVKNYNKADTNTSRTVTLTYDVGVAGAIRSVIVYDDSSKETILMDSVVSDINGVATYEFKLPTSETYIWKAGHTYAAEIDGKPCKITGNSADDNKFKIVAFPSTTDSPSKPGSNGGTTSSGKRPGTTGSGTGSSVVIPGTTLSNNSVGEAILNPNLYQKYGATASNITSSVTKPTANTFIVNISINGAPVTMFSGYDAVMIKVPFATSTANPNNLVVYNQNGTIVPRSLYRDGYMYVRTNNIAGIFTIAENSVLFNDISNATHDWAMTAVNALAARTIINGVGNGNFEPNRSVTRAEFVKMIISMFDIQNTAASAAFADVSAADWFNSYVGTAQQLGITNGYEDGSFRPNNTISREEMSTMLYRAAEVLSVSIESTNNAQTFDDDWNIQDYAKIPVYKMRSAGILNGVGNNLYDPKNDCTRAQSAVAIYNMFIVSMR